jgi:hypothetical protein
MTTKPVVTVTDELIAEFNDSMQLDESALRELVGILIAERAELRRVIKDVSWRVGDTSDQLQRDGFNGEKLYGLDEWSSPIKNLSMAVGILDAAIESAMRSTS